MLPHNAFAYVMIIASALLFYRIGNADYGSGIPLCGLSIIISVISLSFFRFPLVSILVGQVLLFIGLTIYNIVRKKPPSGF